jgi:hypothetical protein
MTDSENRRIDIAASCQDADYIPKVPLAGSVQKGADGITWQIMHNGIKVLADAYYDRFNTEIVRRLRGHHEPQEEKAFHEVLKQIRPGGVMIELGAYWGYYSLWFHKDIAGSINYLIEAVAENLRVGQRNFQLNGFEGHFKRGLIGKEENLTGNPPTITVDGFIRHEALGRIAILHADIQGHEYEMLLGAKTSIRQGLFEFIFISSHGFKVHAQCLRFLRKYGYRILCEHTPAESFAVDGLIVATLDREMATVAITKRHMGVREWGKSFACRLVSRIPV